MTKLGWIFRRALVALAAAAPLTVATCGGVTDTRIEARDKATEATCARYQACEHIGSGKMYPSLDDCKVTWQNNWNNSWTADRCTGKINQAELNVCLSAINATDCANFLDFLATLGKCSVDQVCGGGIDGGTD
jgi:hypothetical protein